MPLPFRDHRQDPAAWAQELDISREAVDLYLSSEVVDLHIDSFLWTRQIGYDLRKRHGAGLGGAWLSQVDLPRVREAQLAGAMWSITTNPFRNEARRAEVFFENLARLRDILESCTDDVALARNLAEYRAARAAGKHAAFLVVQGGNALDAEGALDRLPEGQILRVTVVHLTNSSLGATSSPFARGAGGLTERGRDFVRKLDEKRIFVDLAHVERRGFFDAVAVHDRELPLLVTHTGVSGVFRHWRHLDDDQIRAVADTGGAIGIMCQSQMLGDRTWAGRSETVVRHMEHVIAVGGEDACSFGSDWDGLIVGPRDMRTCLELPRLVQRMLDRKWPEARVRKVLGENFLRTLRDLRG
ncbi:MAG TPA: membrane dipeptidase [Myxococcales bacterium]|nr:membrane dipeptidase [Myxococcales bacterium]